MTAVLVEHEGAIARVTLNRPERFNTLDPVVARQLAGVAEACAADERVRCMVLTGAGRMFCAGGDIDAFSGSGAALGDMLREMAADLHRMVRALLTMAKPLVVLVNGPAAGAGMSLSLLGDVVMAGASAHFTPAYRSVGLTPDGGMSWLLPRLIGLRRAQELLLTDRRVGAVEAAAIGMITTAVPDEELATAGDALAAKLCDGPTGALAATRRLLLDGAASGFDRHLDEEARRIAEAGAGEEAQRQFAARKRT